MNKKDLVIVALATFCLTSTLFMILPSRSAERDPWADVSGPTQGEPDGTINMRDINYEIQHFNQDVSNMTRNVNVTNWQPQDKVVWVGDYLYNSSWQGYIHTGENPAHVGGYEKMTIVYQFPDGGTFAGETPKYLQAELDWRIDSITYHSYPIEFLSTTLYRVEGGQYPAICQISADSYPIKQPYVYVGPRITDNAWDDIGNLTVSVYLYLSDGPTTSSTRKTMEWSEARETDSTTVDVGQFFLDGFTKLKITLHSDVSWNVGIYYGRGANEFFYLTANSWVYKDYELHAGAVAYVSLYSPTATPAWINVEFQAIV